MSQSYEVRKRSNLKANFAKLKQCRSGDFPYVGDVIDVRSTSHDELLFFSFPTIPRLSKSVEWVKNGDRSRKDWWRRSWGGGDLSRLRPCGRLPWVILAIFSVVSFERAPDLSIKWSAIAVLQFVGQIWCNLWQSACKICNCNFRASWGTWRSYISGYPVLIYMRLIPHTLFWPEMTLDPFCHEQAQIKLTNQL